MDTQVLNTRNSGPQRYVSPQAQSSSAPVYTPHPTTSQGHPLGRPYPDSASTEVRVPRGPGMRPAAEVYPQPQPRPEPVFNVKPQNVRSVEERHQAYKLAQEALHDRHYEDNNLRTAAEIALAEFFLA